MHFAALDRTGLKKREGDQQLPEINDNEAIQNLVIVDIEKRREVGTKRYGTPLQAFNGRDALRDAYEEALDLAIYLKQCLVERDGAFSCAACGKPFPPGFSGSAVKGVLHYHFPSCPNE